MADNRPDISSLNDNQVEELRNTLRDFVAGVKDPNSSLLDALVAGHGSHSSVKSGDEPVGPGTGGN